MVRWRSLILFHNSTDSGNVERPCICILYKYFYYSEPRKLAELERARQTIRRCMEVVFRFSLDTTTDVCVPHFRSTQNLTHELLPDKATVRYRLINYDIF